MKKTIALGALSAVGFLFASCAQLTNNRPVGAVYADVVDPVTATGNSGQRVGEATATSYLWGIVALGDASVDAAKRAGGISTVSSVDVKRKNILGAYSTYTTVVRGN